MKGFDVEHEAELLALLRSGDDYQTEQYVTAGKVTTYYYRHGEIDACASITREAAGIGRFNRLREIGEVLAVHALNGNGEAKKEIATIQRELQAIMGT